MNIAFKAPPEQREGIDTIAQALFRLFARSRRLSHDSGEIVASPTPAFRPLLASAGDFLESEVVTDEQSNTSVVFGDALIMKVFRRLADGLNPDLEVTRYLLMRFVPSRKDEETWYDQVAGSA